jgi:DNA polymerase
VQQQPQVLQPHVPQPTGLPWPEQPSWDELQAEVATCSRCGLCKARRNTVFGVGHLRAAVMVVGEAPGEQEDRQGEPFVGAAGQLLDRMLDAIGLSRTAVVDDTGSDQPSARGAAQEAHQVFITNTVKCRPPQNRNPEPTELAACEPVLHRQMELVRPRLVLAMGRFAAQQLLRTDEAIGRLRGRVHRITGAGATWAGSRAYRLW